MKYILREIDSEEEFIKFWPESKMDIFTCPDDDKGKV